MVTVSSGISIYAGRPRSAPFFASFVGCLGNPALLEIMGDHTTAAGPPAKARTHCPGNFRHWFIFPGTTGVRTPVCQRCGAPNPTWMKADQEAWDDWNAPYVPMCNFRNEDRSSFCFLSRGHAGEHRMSKPQPVRTATISDDGLYRYRLGRTWNPYLPKMVWIMLNPSTADAEVDDPTIRRCMGFARREHCGGIEVINLYAFRATKPQGLTMQADPEGPGNCAAWLEVLSGASAKTPGPVVAAWGASIPKGLPESRALDAIVPMVTPPWYTLGLTNGGAPRHPLFVKSTSPLRKWER